MRCLSTISTTVYPLSSCTVKTHVPHAHLHEKHCCDMCSDTLLHRAVTIVEVKDLFNARNTRIQRSVKGLTAPVFFLATTLGTKMPPRKLTNISAKIRGRNEKNQSQIWSEIILNFMS